MSSDTTNNNNSDTTNNNNNNSENEELNSHFFSKNNLYKFSQTYSDKLILIYFTATWCGPCKQIAPFFAKKKKEYKDTNKDVLFKKIDVDDDDYSDLCEELSVSAMPTFLFLRNCNIINKVVGNDEEAITEILNIYS
jgi:thioredoxin 1